MMRRGKRERENMGPAAAALRRRPVFRDARASAAQLSASKLISDAQELQRGTGPTNAITTVVINSPEELALYRQKTRAELEERVKRGYGFLGNWVKYARWEAQQRDYDRMRSVLERAVPLHGASPALWRDYAELEAESGFVAHARAVWDRGVTALPAAEDLWLKYIALEQAAGNDARVRDLFARWVAGPSPSPSSLVLPSSSSSFSFSSPSAAASTTTITNSSSSSSAAAAVPRCAWELFALFEAQRGRADACREILRRYAAAARTPDAWLFFAAAERDALGGGPARAAEVLAQAAEALGCKEEKGKGKTTAKALDCRVLLAWADALAAARDVDSARALYRRLLRECTAPAALDEVFAAYCRFERTYGFEGEGEGAAEAAEAVARVMYERRIARDPHDFDAHVSLVLLLRGDEATAALRAAARAGESLYTAPSPRTEGEQVAFAQLAQRHAVLVMAFARAEERRDAGAGAGAATASAALALCLKAFPFALAQCPRLWLEAAALERRRGDIPAARRLLREAAAATSSSSSSSSSFSSAHSYNHSSRAVLDAAVRLERSAGDADGEREALRGALRAFPDDAALWDAFARLEEREGQPHRADAVRAASIAAFTAAARAAPAMARRYELLGRADRAWARRLAAARRAAAQPQSTVQALYRELLDAVWADLRDEALRWAREARAAAGPLAVGDAPPLALPEALAPAAARWAQAAAAVAEAAPPEEVRGAFRAMVERERGELRRELGDEGGELGFDAAQRARQWADFLLAPIIAEWRRFEATCGTQATLDAVSEVAQPTRRRTRLFARRGN